MPGLRRCRAHLPRRVSKEVSEKRNVPSPARDLYTSDWFIKAASYAGQVADDWYILSARYGLVHPDQVLEPYNATLKTMGKSARQAWAERVFASLKPHLSPGDTVVFLAGQAYREFLLAQVARLGAKLRSRWKGCSLASKCSGSTGI